MKRSTPTTIEIDLTALRTNFRNLKKRTPAGVRSLCVVKSNAYGHGAPRVAWTLQTAGADFFGVGTVDEGIALREAGIKRPILILLGICRTPGVDFFDLFLRHRLTPIVYDLKTAAAMNRFLAKNGKSLPIHIKIDTGMTRLGVLPKDFAAFCEGLRKLRHLEPQGLLTHLAEAGDERFTQRQIEVFRRAIREFEDRCAPSASERYYHVANSQATIDRKTLVGGEAVPLARFGIALYGSYPLERDRRLIPLKPVLSWKTRLIAVKKVQARTAVSYNRTYVTKREGRIGVIPVGYADGYPRLLSNRADVLVGGKRVLVAGNVCMDLMMIDLTKVPKAKVGDEVVLLGRQGSQSISAEELAEKAETISYEIFCRISPRLPRIYS